MNTSTFLGTLAIWTALSSIILVLAWVATQTAKKHAALRHFIWVAAFATLLIVPAMSAFVPARFVIGAEPKHQVVEPTIFAGELSALDNAGFELVAAPIEAPKPYDWKPILTGTIIVWALGFAFLLLKLCLGVLQAQSMRRASRLREISPIVPNRSTEVRVSLTRRPPCALTWGFFRPIVILPQDSESWSAEKLDAVMRHELAHVRRFDSLSQMLALTLCAVYWFNPLVWLAANALRADAEIAADDAVVRSGISPSAYAAELLQIATEFGRQRQPLTTIGVSLMKQSQIETRIMSIVDPTNRRRGVAKIQGLSVLAIGAFGAVAIVSLRPAIAVAQDSQKPAIATKTATGQAIPVKPADATDSMTVTGIQIAPAKAVIVKGKKASKKSKKVKGQVFIQPAVPANRRNSPQVEVVLGQPVPAQSALSRASGVSDPSISVPAATIQVKPANGPIKATFVQNPAGPSDSNLSVSASTIQIKLSHDPMTVTFVQDPTKATILTKATAKNTKVNYYWSPKTKKYRTKPSGNSPVQVYYSTGISRVNYTATVPPAKYSVSTIKPTYKSTVPLVGNSISTVEPTIRQDDKKATESEKARRLEEVQLELNQTRAQKQAMEVERNVALAKLRKAQAELEIVRLKQSKSKNGKSSAYQTKRAKLELEYALEARRRSSAKADSEIRLLVNRRADLEDKKALEMKMQLDKRAVNSREMAKVIEEKRAAERKARAEAIRTGKRGGEFDRKIEAERAAKREVDRATELGYRAKREAELKAVEEKARAEKKKSGGS